MCPVNPQVITRASANLKGTIPTSPSVQGGVDPVPEEMWEELSFILVD